MVEESFHDINMSNLIDKRMIDHGFDICGLNPLIKDLTPFHNHLKSLSENGIYNSLLDNNVGLKLDVESNNA